MIYNRTLSILYLINKIYDYQVTIKPKNKNKPSSCLWWAYHKNRMKGQKGENFAEQYISIKFFLL